jgi:outer membrane protein assembly factor BamB
VDTPDFGILLKNGTPLVVGSTFTQTEINQGNLVYSNSLTTDGNDSFKVNILNPIQSWLPNQIINIQINGTLSFENFENQEIKVYPNPSSGIVYIQSSSFWQNASVVVTDITGRKISKSEISKDDLAIDLSHLSEGLYLISVEKDAQKNTFKILLKR